MTDPISEKRPTPQETLTKEFPVVIALDVRWGDMDAFQHVNNTQYFRYFEQVRIAYFDRSISAEAPDAGLPRGIGPILHSTSCRFRAPVKYPDTLHVGARVSNVAKDRFSMEFKVISERLSCVAAEGEAIIVSFDYSNGRKAELPPAWTEAIERVEKGEASPST